VRAILLARKPGGNVEATIGFGEAEAKQQTLKLTELPHFVRGHEAESPRWMWDDTTKWYPDLLQAGVTVKRCYDVRLCHNILRSSPFTDRTQLMHDETDAWDRLQPAESETQTLFDSTDLGQDLDVVTESERQRAALAASEERDRLTLLLNAESAGALAAAEMTHAGLPWSVEAHEQLLHEKLGPRPQAGKRPERLEQLVTRIREALQAPDLNPDSPADLLSALQKAGLDVTSTVRGISSNRITPSFLTYWSTRSWRVYSVRTAGNGSTNGSRRAGSARSCWSVQ
jgi:DNA polymerase-1